MLGLGESEDETIEAIRDFKLAGVDILTMGQYLQPSLRHLPVCKYIQPEEFEKLGILQKPWASFTSLLARLFGVHIERGTFSHKKEYQNLPASKFHLNNFHKAKSINLILFNSISPCAVLEEAQTVIMELPVSSDTH